jgi:hypothetical protein
LPYSRLPAGLTASDLGWVSVRSAFKPGASYADLSIALTTNRSSSSSREEDDGAAEERAGPETGGCLHEGHLYQPGEEFHSGGCGQYCLCQENGRAACFDIQCPSKFGLDVISPDCIAWDEHLDFVPVPPACCPPVPVCLSDGSCGYKGQNFSNYASLPQELTGCEERCHCENGEVTCSPACYAVTKDPPAWLECEEGQEEPRLIPNPERTCCKIWGCGPVVETPPTSSGDACQALPARLVGTTVTPINESSIAIFFEIPEAAAGRRGHYVVNYASGFGGHPDPERWPADVFKTADGRIDTKESVRKVFGPLVPNTEYFLRPAIVINDCDGGNNDDSAIGGSREKLLIGEVLSTRTLPVGGVPGGSGSNGGLRPSTADSLPIVVYLDLKLEVGAVGASSARVTWRHFEPEEKPYIDGVQLRYLALKGDTPLSQVPETTPFIHRDTNYFVFEGLRPDTRYEVEVDLIPLPGSGKELYSGTDMPPPPPNLPQALSFWESFDNFTMNT